MSQLPNQTTDKKTEQDNLIASNFGIEPKQPEEIVQQDDDLVADLIEEQKPKIDLSTLNPNIDSDFDFSRKKLESTIQLANEALTSALNLAKTIDKPSGFQAVAELINAATNSTVALVDIHQRLSKTKTEDALKNTACKTMEKVNVEGNAVFVGSTKDLQEQFLKKTVGRKTTEDIMHETENMVIDGTCTVKKE